MRIDRVDLMIVRLRLVHPFDTSTGRTDALDHILVKVHTEDVVGWGECAVLPDPYYWEETTETCWHVLKDFLAPAVVGREWHSINELVGFYGKVRRNNFAKAGLEAACWDALAKAQKQPLWQLLGGTQREVTCGVSLGLEQDEERLFALIDRYLAEGYRRVKLKIAPGRDVEVLKMVRDRYPDTPIMADANAAYCPDDLPTLQQLDEFKLMMIEQPFGYDDLAEHATLQRQIQTPICLDESIDSLQRAKQALDLNSCRIVNIKPGRVGGLLEARKIHELCQARGIPVWCGGMHEFGIGRAANVALSTLPGFTVPGDISGSDKYYVEDLIDPPIRVHAGAIPISMRPGIGYSISEERIRQFVLREHALQV